jgi:hypothetical protein
VEPGTRRPAPRGALDFSEAESRAFQAVAPYLRGNPRHVKRLVNVYALVRSLAQQRGDQSVLDDPLALVRWLTLSAQWPYAAREMLRRLDAHVASRAADPPRAPLPYLLAAALPALDRAERARVDHDAALLDGLVAADGGPTWEQVRALRRYTANFNPAVGAEPRADDPPAPGERSRRAGRPSRAALDLGGGYDRRGRARAGRQPPAERPSARPPAG